MTLDTILQAKIYELQAELDSLIVKAVGIEKAINALKGILKNTPEIKELTMQPKPVEKPKKSLKNSEYVPEPGTGIRKLYDTLLAHPNQVFRYTELGNLAKVPMGSLAPNLTFLKKKGLVKHENRYWSAV